MAAITDNKGMPSDWLVREGEVKESRKAVTLLAGSGAARDLKSGTVLSRVRGAAAAAVAGAGNVGNGVFGTVTAGAGAQEGAYRVVFIEPTTNLGTFQVFNPAGVEVGEGVVGTAFTGGGISFTIADGSTDFAAGDDFTVTVAVGTKYVPYDQDGTNGSEIARGILLFDTIVPDGADKAATIIDRNAQVRKGGLVWPSTIEAAEITTAEAHLEALGIRIRQGDV